MTSSAAQSIRPPRRAESGRPLRRDAARNRQRILAAAAELFTERGLHVTLDEVARRAGVGVGTVYRRFPDKEALTEALFEDRITALVTLAEQARAEPDPWAGLVSFLERAGALLTADLGLRQIVMFASYGRDRVGEARARLLPQVTALVRRAQAAGVVRADLRPTDVPVIEFMLAAVADYAGPGRPELWRRYLGLILDGLRPSRPGSTPLPVAALSPAEVERAMRASGPPGPPR
jgi:AcrR family transcriptional regulator